METKRRDPELRFCLLMAKDTRQKKIRNWVSARRNHRFTMGFTHRFRTSKPVFTKHAVLHIRNFGFRRRKPVQTGANRCKPGLLRPKPGLPTGLPTGLQPVSPVTVIRNRFARGVFSRQLGKPGVNR